VGRVSFRFGRWLTLWVGWPVSQGHRHEIFQEVLAGLAVARCACRLDGCESGSMAVGTRARHLPVAGDAARGVLAQIQGRGRR